MRETPNKLSENSHFRRLQKPLFSLLIFVSIISVDSINAEDVPRKAFVREYTNYNLGIESFDFKSNGKCSIKVSDPEANKTKTYHCTWKQVDKSNKIVLSWLSKAYKKMAGVPETGDIYYLILNGQSMESIDHCLVRKPTEYDSANPQVHDLMELSNGLPICTRK